MILNTWQNIALSTAQKVRRSAPVMCVIIITIAVYSVTSGFQLFDFWDDLDYITTNATVLNFTAANLKQAFSSYYVGNYAPLHIISYMVDHEVWGLNASAYHLENVLFHLANGLLLYCLLRRLSLPEWQSLGAVWLFLLHPVQVETVAWVSQRKNLLAMFFFLIAMLEYQSYSAPAVGRSGRIVHYSLSVICLVAALLSKSIAVIFPAVIIGYDVAYGKDRKCSVTWRLIEKVPYVAVAGAVALLAVMSQAPDAGGGRRDFPGGSPLSAFFTMVPVLARYIGDCFWPLELSPYYIVTIRRHPDAVFIASLLCLLLVFAVGCYLYRHNRPLLFWCSFFFIALVPVLQIVPLITLKNDRYLYFPLAGFSVAMAMLVSHLTRKSRLLLIPVGVIMVVLPMLTLQQVSYWRDDVTLWNRSVQIDPENQFGWLQLSKIYTRHRDVVHALQANGHYNQLKIKHGSTWRFEDF